MEEEKFNMLWTLVWLLFIAFLCYIFQSCKPIWLLIIWFLGMEY